jgi:hypothetical protein
MDKFIIKTECFNSEKKLFRSTSYAISSIHDRLLIGFITVGKAGIAACGAYNNHENRPVRPKNYDNKRPHRWRPVRTSSKTL